MSGPGGPLSQVVFLEIGAGAGCGGALSSNAVSPLE